MMKMSYQGKSNGSQFFWFLLLEICIVKQADKTIGMYMAVPALVYFSVY